MKILVTGGLGYIGSHTVVALLDQGYEVVIIDDLSNSTVDVLEGITEITNKTPEFHKLDLRDKIAVAKFFDQYPDLKGIIHFAASKAVGESVEKPLLYYENNVGGLIHLLRAMQKRNLSNFIFSSSCTVYGQADELPITESARLKKAESPYGNTKLIGENMIADYAKSEKEFKAISLRYFNPIGAHPSAKIGELPIGTPQNLVPFITQTAIGKRKELSVFGDDYNTPDGTCIRDYIHVMDLAEAHVRALERLLKNEATENYEVFNLGTGTGSSVMEIIQTFEKVTQQNLPYKMADRRAGDVTAAYADIKKANQILGWKAKRSLDKALSSAWEWEKNQPKD
ncbi:MAG TPA: UDP-glucose 4-epimerase GalE [Flavobacteriaceae bacterium]|nr:UDP-glucose 4-epimerase GalE [Flavobacteriaceae bacterium]